MITKMRGFTLIETLLALAILAVLSAAAVMVLQNVIRADGLTREKSQQIAALQRRLGVTTVYVTHDQVEAMTMGDRVAVRLRQQQLERLSFDQQDPLTGSQPTVRVLLREVTAFRLRFYADGRWQETWDRPQRLPQGLEITLTLANSGEITRLFLLTPGGGQ